ncbi:MAG: hypothetical protein Q4P72_03005, partial [Eubacteriales bacterium]|nr:hypothetical protein [Eubacteriales bacterium]
MLRKTLKVRRPLLAFTLALGMLLPIATPLSKGLRVAAETPPSAGTSRAADAVGEPALQGRVRDAASTHSVNTQFVSLTEGNSHDVINMETMAQFHVTPYDLYGGSYKVRVPRELVPFIDHIESDAYGGIRTWTWDEAKREYTLPIMALEGGLFSQTWIGSNPNYSTMRIVLNKKWDEASEALKVTEKNNVPFVFYARFSDGDIIEDFINTTSISLVSLPKLQKVVVAGAQVIDNYVSNAKMDLPMDGYDAASNSLTLTNYFHIAPFVTYTTAAGNKPYTFNIQLDPSMAKHVESIDVSPLMLAGGPQRFDRSYNGMANFDETGLLVINAFNEKSINDIAEARDLFSRDTTGAYPLFFDIKINFKEDISTIMQDASSGSSIDPNRHVYVQTYLNAPRGKNGGIDGMVKNSYASAYYSFKDSDGDGLLDTYELYNSFTDPNNPDTDGDGKNDYEEVHTTLTDPNVKAPEVKDIAESTKKYLINTEPYRLVKLVDVATGTTVAEGRADAEGSVVLNTTDKLVGLTQVKLEVYTDESTKTSVKFTQTYTNPETSEVFNVINGEIIDPANVRFLFKDHKDISIPIYGDDYGIPFSNKYAGNARYTIEVKIPHTHSGDKYVVSAYDEDGNLLATQDPQPIYWNTHEIYLDLTDAAMTGKYVDGQTLRIVAKRFISAQNKWTATTPWDQAVQVVARGRLEAPTVRIDPSTWDGKGYTGVIINGDPAANIVLLRLGNLKKYDRTKIPFEEGSAVHMALAGQVGYKSVPADVWLDPVVAPTDKPLVNGSYTGRLGAVNNADLYPGQFLTAYIADSASATDDKSTRYSLPTLIIVPQYIDMAKVVKVEVVTPPDKIDYAPMDSHAADPEAEKHFDPKGTVLKLTDDQGRTVLVRDDQFEEYGITISGETDYSAYMAADAGDKKVTFTASLADVKPSVDQTVTIIKPEFDYENIVTIRDKQPQTQTEFYIDEVFNGTGFLATLTDIHGTEIDAGLKDLINLDFHVLGGKTPEPGEEPLYEDILDYTPGVETAFVKPFVSVGPKDILITRKDVKGEAHMHLVVKHRPTPTPSVNATNTAYTPATADTPEVPGKTELVVTPGNAEEPFKAGDKIKVTLPGATPEAEPVVTEYTVGDANAPLVDGKVKIDLGNELKNGTEIKVTATQGTKTESDPATATVVVDRTKADAAIAKVPADLDVTKPTDKAVDDAKKALETILAKPDKTQKEVDDATKALEDALKAKETHDATTQPPTVEAKGEAYTPATETTPEVPGKTNVKVTPNAEEGPFKAGDVITIKV